MTTMERPPAAQVLTDEQRKNARQTIQRMKKGRLDISTSRDTLPDIGPLGDAFDMLLSNYRDAGASAIAGTIQALSSDYPILLDLDRKNKYEPVDLIDLLNMPEQEWILTNFLYEDALSVVYGPPGSYKSFIVLDWMCHIALGKPWQGRQVKRCRVIYLAAEGVRGYKRRMNAWCTHFGVKPEDLKAYLSFIPLAVPLANTAEVSEYIEAIQDKIDEYTDDLPIILVIDTLFQCAAGQSINSPEVMTALVSAAQRTKMETNATHVLIVHHSGKDVQRGMSGNLALKGSTDISYLIEADKFTGLITIKSDKIKDDEDVTTYVQRQRVEYGAGPRDNSCVIISAERPEKAEKYTPTEQKILMVLPYGAPGQSFSEIQKLIKEQTGKDMRNGTLSDNLKRLQERGKVIKLEEGGYYQLAHDLAKEEEEDNG